VPSVESVSNIRGHSTLPKKTVPENRGHSLLLENSIPEKLFTEKLSPIFGDSTSRDFSLFCPKFGCHGNAHWTFAIRNVFFGLANHKNSL